MPSSDEDREGAKGLDEFLAKVDEVGNLVKGLVTSEDGAASDAALEKADGFLQRSSKEDCKTIEDKLIINKSSNVASSSNGHKEEMDVSSFCKSVEEDARERAARRKERERKGKDIKKKANSSFKSGDYEKALEQYALALKETPWDTTLHTNRALTFNSLQQYTAACEECDRALRVDPTAVKAYVHKANALKALKETEKAKECLSAGLKECPAHHKDLQYYLDKLQAPNP